MDDQYAGSRLHPNRLAHRVPVQALPQLGEIAYVAQSANGEHAEFKPTRIIAERHWLSLRLDL